MKVLRIGDPHAKVTNLAEMEKLMGFVLLMATTHAVNRIEILGDLFHNHFQIRLEVLEFWDKWLDQLSDLIGVEVVVLVGNHDQSGDYKAGGHALSVFKRNKKPNLYIVDKELQLGPFGYLPYIHSSDEFLGRARKLYDAGARTLVSHTTYSGSKYESGMYAPDGIDPELLPFDTLITGHIHSRQRFSTPSGKSVIMPGTSRWDTASDANEPKGLWLVEHDGSTGKIVAEQFLDTSNVVTPIVSVTLREGDAIPTFPTNARVAVDLIGSSAWVTKMKSQLKGYSVSTQITDKKSAVERSAGKNLEDFVTNLYVSTMDRQVLLKYMKEMGLV